MFNKVVNRKLLIKKGVVISDKKNHKETAPLFVKVKSLKSVHLEFYNVVLEQGHAQKYYVEWNTF